MDEPASFTCDSCGQEFEGEPMHDTHSVGHSSEAVRNETALLQLCPNCTASRRTLPAFVAFVLMLTVGVLTLLSILFHWKQS